MSLTIQVPPTMEQEALAYAEMRGITLEAILVECLRREMDARREREQRGSLGSGRAEGRARGGDRSDLPQ